MGDIPNEVFPNSNDEHLQIDQGIGDFMSPDSLSDIENDNILSKILLEPRAQTTHNPQEIRQPGIAGELNDLCTYDQVEQTTTLSDLLPSNSIRGQALANNLNDPFLSDSIGFPELVLGLVGEDLDLDLDESNTTEEIQDNSSLAELGNISNMDLTFKPAQPDAASAALSLLQLSGNFPAGSELESEISQDSITPLINIKRESKRKSGEYSSSASGDGHTTPTNKRHNGRSSRRSKKKEFMHQKNLDDPIVQRARYAKTYRERKKQEHEKEVKELKGIIAERDSLIEKLTVENDSMSKQLTEHTLSRQETVKFSENIASIVNAVSSAKGVDIHLHVSPNLGDLNSSKLSAKECKEIVHKSELVNQKRFTLTFDYHESDKGKTLKIEKMEEDLNE